MSSLTALAVLSLLCSSPLHVNTAFAHFLLPLCFAGEFYGNPAYLTLFKFLTIHKKTSCRRRPVWEEGGSPLTRVFISSLREHAFEDYLLTCLSSHSILMDIPHSLSDSISTWQNSALPLPLMFIRSMARPAKIDWDKNRKEDSMLKIQSESRATSAESHLGLIGRYEVWTATLTSRYISGLKGGNIHRYCIRENII